MGLGFDLSSLTCAALTAATVSMEERPEFSASALGVHSSASEKARIAYCSMVFTLSASSETLSEHAISAAPAVRVRVRVRVGVG